MKITKIWLLFLMFALISQISLRANSNEDNIKETVYSFFTALYSNDLNSLKKLATPETFKHLPLKISKTKLQKQASEKAMEQFKNLEIAIVKVDDNSAKVDCIDRNTKRKVMHVFLEKTEGEWQVDLAANLAEARTKVKQISCINNLKQLIILFYMYSIDHNDTFPQQGGVEAIKEIYSHSNLSKSLKMTCLVSPLTSTPAPESIEKLTEENFSYIVLPKIDKNCKKPSQTVAMFIKPTDNKTNQVGVAYVDGHCSVIKLDKIYTHPRQVLEKHNISGKELDKYLEYFRTLGYE